MSETDRNGFLASPYKQRFLIKNGDRWTPVRTDNIAGFIVADRHVSLYTRVNKKYIVDHTLDQLEKMLDPTSFFRINRKAILSFDAIRHVESYFSGRLRIEADLIVEEELIVSRERVNDFKKWLDL